MSVMRSSQRPPPQGPLEFPERLEGVYKVTEAFRSISVAWEAIVAGSWSTAAIQSFAALARRVALDLSTLGCGALDSAVVELVLALDAITVGSGVGEQQLGRVDHSLAAIRAVAVQRLLALGLYDQHFSSEEGPVLLHETCPRCASSGLCTIIRNGRRIARSSV